jgi:hypothetical protein
MAKYDIERCDDPASPDRCQAIASRGQCVNKKVGVSQFCPVHGGNRANQAKEAKGLNMYRLAKYQERLGELSTANNIKTLHSEIGILRILMEEMLNRVSNPAELCAATPQLADLCIKVEKLVTSCHKLEKSLSQYLDKSAIIHLAQETVAIISKYIDDPSVAGKIADEIASVIDRMENLET